MRLHSALAITAFAAWTLALSAHAAEAPEVFAAIDAKLRAGEWTAARELALEQLDVARGSLYARYLGGVAARLAVAEAGLGRLEDAVWHWQVARNVDREALSAEVLASFGDAGAALAHQGLRQAGEAPEGMAVHRAGVEGDGVRPPRKLAGEQLELSPTVGQLPVPKALRVEVVIDAEGRPRAPVVIGSAVPGMIWEALEALRGWRYEPALEGGYAVAVFHDLRFNSPAFRPLGEIVALSEQAVAAEKLLRAGQWREAGSKARRAWIAALDDRQPKSDLLAASLALRALADAGEGESREAVCRWQAAQHLEERLYGADLTPYRSAGALLERHRWGVAAAPSTREPGASKVKRARHVEAGALPATAQGIVFLMATVDEHGDLHQPLILGKRKPMTPDSLVTAFTHGTGPLDVSWLGALVALDALCDWSFEPARTAGRPVSSELVMTVPVGPLSAFVHSGVVGGAPDGGAFISSYRVPSPRVSPP